MAWIESHQELERHPKTQQLMFLTGWNLDETIGKLHRFWWWVLAFCENGDLSKYKPSQFMKLLDPQSDPDDLYKKFVECSFIDQNGKIHDWLDYAGRYLNGKYRTSNPNKLKEIEKTLRRNSSRTKVSLKTDNLPTYLNLPNLPPSSPPTGGMDVFETFWDRYPKKRSKGQAERAWQKLQPTEQLQGQILAALERAKTSAEWAKDGGRFIPHPATWLNAKGWDDDYASKSNEDLWITKAS